MWYRRHECGLRMAIFFSAATAAGAFGGLLARGIAEMDGGKLEEAPSSGQPSAELTTFSGRQGWLGVDIHSRGAHHFHHRHVDFAHHRPIIC